MYCRHPDITDRSRHIAGNLTALWFIALLAGCGGENDVGTPSGNVSRPSSTAVTQPAPSTVQTPESSGPPAASAEQSALLARLDKIPHLSSLSASEKAGLLRQLPFDSASQRLALLDRYPSLATLPVQQKQVLLEQLAQVVPVSISPSLLTCDCGTGKLEMCVKESCSNGPGLLSTCVRVCGPSAQIKTQCVSSTRCAGK